MNFKDALNPIRSLKATFSAMNLAPAQLWGGGILIAFLDAWTNQSGNQSGGGMDEDLMLIMICIGCTFALIGFLGSAWVRPGVFHNLKSVLQTGEVDSRGIFDARELFVPLLLARFLKMVITLAVTVLLLSPLIAAFVFSLSGEEAGVVVLIGAGIFFVLVGLPTLIYLTSGLAFVEEFVVFGGASPMEALSQAWNLASGNRLQISLYGLVTGIFAFLGILLCCVGVLATSAVATLAWGEAYLQLSGGEGGGDVNQAGDSDSGGDIDFDDRRVLED